MILKNYVISTISIWKILTLLHINTSVYNIKGVSKKSVKNVKEVEGIEISRFSTGI